MADIETDEPTIRRFMSPAVAVAEPGMGSVLANGRPFKERRTHPFLPHVIYWFPAACRLRHDKKNPARSGARRIIATLRYDAFS
ncbi:hypothetical protein [Bradyrhizobium sp. AZCC 1693]|uniref:hypothetical protein n=1 Tax=Bradyrhizobium sp. AZCC 1693 TaxID=3117029 RepID=UPI002FEF08F7